jgi:hypothetical protein
VTAAATDTTANVHGGGGGGHFRISPKRGFLMLGFAEDEKNNIKHLFFERVFV